MTKLNQRKELVTRESQYVTECSIVVEQHNTTQVLIEAYRLWQHRHAAPHLHQILILLDVGGVLKGEHLCCDS